MGRKPAARRRVGPKKKGRLVQSTSLVSTEVTASASAESEVMDSTDRGQDAREVVEKSAKSPLLHNTVGRPYTCSAICSNCLPFDCILYFICSI